MSAEFDLSEYLDLFLQEAREQLEVLEAETLKLEAEPSMDRLQIIFRAAHTLKGSARAMGFTHLAELTHEMENLLDALRNGQLRVDTQIADSLLACQDSLSQMIASIEGGKGDAVECTSLVRELQRIQGTAPALSPELKVEAGGSLPLLPEHELLALSAASEEKSVFYAQVKLHPECVMKFVRAFMAIGAAQENGGELLATVPNREDLEEEKFDLEFSLFFQTPDALEDVRARLGAVSEVESLHVGVWTAPTSAELTPSSPNLELQASREVASAPNGVGGTSPAPAKRADSGQTVRVDVSRLDALMNLVGELVIDRTRIAQIGGELAAKYRDPNLDALSETVSHVHRITSDLQDQIMKARMMPIESVFNRFPRVVRDLANKLGKEVRLNLSGGETELDRSVIEVIGDPLLHILRNSVDHGLELPADRQNLGKARQGLVRLSARHEENHIVIEITDDGRGIDVERVRSKAISSGVISSEAADRMSEKEALQLIFASGLSTASEVSEVSGRGVGMDIVRSNIQKLGGLIDLDTTPGQGTRFTLRLPLTLAIIRGLLVEVGGVTYVIPLGSVVETLLVPSDTVQSVNRREVIVLRGRTTPLVRLSEKLCVKMGSAHPTADPKASQFYVVIVGLAEQRIGLVVNRLIGEREVVIKSLSRFCGDVDGISGATILGDGNVALILDVNGTVATRGNQ